MQGLRKGFLTLHSRRSSIPNFCHLYPEYRFFPSTTSRSEISANPVALVVVNSRIPGRNSAFSRIPHCMSAKSRIPRMLDSSLSSVKTWRPRWPRGFSDSAMTKKKLKMMRFAKYPQYSFHTRGSFHKKNHNFWKTKPNFWHNIQLCSLSKYT